MNVTAQKNKPSIVSQIVKIIVRMNHDKNFNKTMEPYYKSLFFPVDLAFSKSVLHALWPLYMCCSKILSPALNYHSAYFLLSDGFVGQDNNSHPLNDFDKHVCMFDIAQSQKGYMVDRRVIE